MLRKISQPSEEQTKLVIDLKMRLDSLFMEPPVSKDPAVDHWRNLPILSVEYLMDKDEVWIESSLMIDTITYDSLGYYTGQVQDGKRQGFGRLVILESFSQEPSQAMNQLSGIYEGSWRDNKFDGFGRAIW